MRTYSDLCYLDETLLDSMPVRVYMYDTGAQLVYLCVSCRVMHATTFAMEEHLRSAHGVDDEQAIETLTPTHSRE